MPTLEWLSSIYPEIVDDSALPSQAALAGRLEVLRWLKGMGAPFGWTFYLDATFAGRLDVADWLREDGCPWEDSATLVSLTDGRFHLLEWALRNRLFAGVRSVRPELESWDRFERWLAGERDDSNLYPTIDTQLLSDCDDLDDWLARPRRSREARKPDVLRWHTVGRWVF